MQDISLTEEENTSSPASNDAAKAKSGTLKRLFRKAARKAAEKERTDAAVANAMDAAEAGEDLIIGATPELKEKTNTLSRFLTRLKGANKTIDSDQPSTSSNATLDTNGKPIPNEKPTLKSSLSTYWRNMFKRHQTSAEADNETKGEHVAGTMELEELPQEQNIKENVGQLPPSNIAEISIAKEVEEGKEIAEFDSVQVLPISEEVEPMEESSNGAY